MENAKRRWNTRASIWSGIAAICAIFVVSYFAGWQAGIGITAIIAILLLGSALQDALGRILIKLESVPRLFAARR